MTKKGRAWLAAVAASVVGTLVVEWLFDFPVLGFLGGILATVASWLTTPVSLSRWQLLLLIGFAGVLAVAVVYRVFMEVVGQRGWRNYTSDRFIGVDWIWSYAFGNDITGLVPTCPECNYQMTVEDRSAYHPDPKTALVCDDCGFEVPHDTDWGQLESRVRRLIQRNLRMGRYPGGRADPST